MISRVGDRKGKKDQCSQTDTEMFFKYIFDFLALLEKRISSGEISIEEILAQGRQAMFEDASPASKAA